jgi:hypothetical protein
LALLLLFGLCAGALACPAGSTPDDEVPLGPFERYLEARCAALERCADSHGRAFPNARVCRDRERALVDCGFEVRDPVFHRKVKLQWRWRGGETLDECVSWLDSATCDQVHELEHPPCRDLLEIAEALGPGQACEGWEDVCQVDLVCAHPTEESDTCAVCLAAAAAGEACDPTQPACAAGLFCDAASARCAPLRHGGEGCAEDAQCRSGSCLTQGCRALAGRGGACAENADCGWELRCIGGACGDGLDEGAACAHSGECLGGLYCMYGACRAYSLCAELQRDTPCPFPFDSCEYDSYCSPYTLTCDHMRASYSDCSYANWECLEDLFCDYEESPPGCEHRREDGADCQRDVECLSNLCESQRCVAPTPCSVP